MTSTDGLDELVGALDAALNGMHPVYSSTTGPYGGVGGQAMTQWCQRNSPSSVVWDEYVNRAEDVLRKHCQRLEREGRSITDIRWKEPRL